MTKRIELEVEQGGRNEIRPDFFREPPVKYTGGDLPWQWEEDGMICTRSGAWAAPGCHDGCGVIIYTDKETGKFIKVEGDPESPYYQGRLCARCITLKDAIYHPRSRSLSHEACSRGARQPGCLGAHHLG